MKMIIANPLCRGGTDCGNFGSADFASVIVEFEEDIEERVDPVDAGKDDPVVPVRILNDFGELSQICRRFNTNGWKFDDICPEIAKLRGQHAGLLPGSGDHDPFAG